MRVTFCLPVTGHRPIGGHKVLYEYANGLSRRGHQVTLVHPFISRKDAGLLERVGRRVVNSKRWMAGQHTPRNWFTLDPDVRHVVTLDLDAARIPDADVVVATAWQTAEWVAGYPASKGAKVYLIQSLETWNGPTERVHATWDLDLEKIVIAKWLGEFAAQRNQAYHFVPNGLSFETFGKDVEPGARFQKRILMLCHASAVKGSRNGVAALESARGEFPDLEADLFGVDARPKWLPTWIRYHQNPPQSALRKLYNAAAIFLAPSLVEGWPLPPAEAMQCGAAVVATDIGGHREFMDDERTALLSSPGDAAGMAKQLCRVLGDNSLRLRIADNGHAAIQKFVWSVAIDKMERILMNAADRRRSEKHPQAGLLDELKSSFRFDDEPSGQGFLS